MKLPHFITAVCLITVLVWAESSDGAESTSSDVNSPLKAKTHHKRELFGHVGKFSPGYDIAHIKHSYIKPFVVQYPVQSFPIGVKIPLKNPHHQHHGKSPHIHIKNPVHLPKPVWPTNNCNHGQASHSIPRPLAPPIPPTTPITPIPSFNVPVFSVPVRPALVPPVFNAQPFLPIPAPVAPLAVAAPVFPVAPVASFVPIAPAAPLLPLKPIVHAPIVPAPSVIKHGLSTHSFTFATFPRHNYVNTLPALAPAPLIPAPGPVFSAPAHVFPGHLPHLAPVAPIAPVAPLLHRIPIHQYPIPAFPAQLPLGRFPVGPLPIGVGKVPLAIQHPHFFNQIPVNFPVAANGPSPFPAQTPLQLSPFPHATPVGHSPFLPQVPLGHDGNGQPQFPAQTPFDVGGHAQFPTQTPFGGNVHPQFPEQTPLGVNGHPQFPEQTPFGVSGHPQFPEQTPLGVNGHPQFPEQTPFGVSGHPQFPEQTPLGPNGQPQFPAQTPFGEPGFPQQTPVPQNPFLIPGTSDQFPTNSFGPDSAGGAGISPDVQEQGNDFANNFPNVQPAVSNVWTPMSNPAQPDQSFQYPQGEQFPNQINPDGDVSQVNPQGAAGGGQGNEGYIYQQNGNQPFQDGQNLQQNLQHQAEKHFLQAQKYYNQHGQPPQEQGQQVVDQQQQNDIDENVQQFSQQQFISGQQLSSGDPQHDPQLPQALPDQRPINQAYVRINHRRRLRKRPHHNQEK